MSSPAERMLAMRKRRGVQGLREVRLVVADPRAALIGRLIAPSLLA